MAYIKKGEKLVEEKILDFRGISSILYDATNFVEYGDYNNLDKFRGMQEAIVEELAAWVAALLIPGFGMVGLAAENAILEYFNSNRGPSFEEIGLQFEKEAKSAKSLLSNHAYDRIKVEITSSEYTVEEDYTTTALFNVLEHISVIGIRGTNGIWTEIM